MAQKVAFFAPILRRDPRSIVLWEELLGQCCLLRVTLKGEGSTLWFRSGRGETVRVVMPAVVRTSNTSCMLQYIDMSMYFSIVQSNPKTGRRKGSATG